MGLEGGLCERPIEPVDCGGQLAARGAGRLVPSTANVALTPTRGISATMCTRALRAYLRRDNRLRTDVPQATVPSQGGFTHPCTAGNAGHAAPSKAARYFWWRRRRWPARGVRGCGPGAFASSTYGRRVRRTCHRPVHAGPTAGPVGRRRHAKAANAPSFDSTGLKECNIPLRGLKECNTARLDDRTGQDRV